MLVACKQRGRQNSALCYSLIILYCFSKRHYSRAATFCISYPITHHTVHKLRLLSRCALVGGLLAGKNERAVALLVDARIYAFIPRRIFQKLIKKILKKGDIITLVKRFRAYLLNGICSEIYSLIEAVRLMYIAKRPRDTDYIRISRGDKRNFL